MVQLKIEQAKAGVLDTSSKQTSVEFAQVVAVGKGVEHLNSGDKVFVKSWAIDIITHQDKKYYFVNIESNGILATVQ